MKNIINNVIMKLYSQIELALAGAMLLGVFQVPFLPAELRQPVEKSGKNAEIAAVLETQTSLKHEFFGTDAEKKATAEMIDKKVEFVSTRPAYLASLAVIKKHERTIKEKARENGVPEDVAIGVGLLENGGSETAKSPAGALGVFQLMPGTAKSLGLTVDKKVDERRIPEKNIDAGMRYLKSNYERFGDWGLATWAYHAGEGNVSKAVKIYAKEVHGVTLKGVKDSETMREYVEENSLTIHKLLSQPEVKKFTKKLNDDSAGYPYKVIATAKLFKDASRGASLMPGFIVGDK